MLLPVRASKPPRPVSIHSCSVPLLHADGYAPACPLVHGRYVTRRCGLISESCAQQQRQRARSARPPHIAATGCPARDCPALHEAPSAIQHASYPPREATPGFLMPQYHWDMICAQQLQGGAGTVERVWKGCARDGIAPPPVQKRVLCGRALRVGDRPNENVCIAKGQWAQESGVYNARVCLYVCVGGGGGLLSAVSARGA